MVYFRLSEKFNLMFVCQNNNLKLSFFIIFSFAATIKLIPFLGYPQPPIFEGVVRCRFLHTNKLTPARA